MPSPSRLTNAVEEQWETVVLPALGEYTALPCLSPAFDAQWADNGHLLKAVHLLQDWCRRRHVPGLTAEIIEREARTPVLLVEIPPSPPSAGSSRGSGGRDEPEGPGGRGPGSSTGAGGSPSPLSSPCVLFYGHFDKQPALGPWRDGLGPFTPVRHDDRLFGRGTADDGYATFSAVSAVEVAAALGLPYPRVVALIEGSEESGSPDLPTYLDAVGTRIGSLSVVVALDASSPTYDRLWTAASLRGNLVATVTVAVLTRGLHSGLAGGVVPSSFRILRQLLSRIEDEVTGDIRLAALTDAVPEDARRQIADVASELGSHLSGLPTVPGLVLEGSDPTDQLVRQAWSPALAVTGLDGAPRPPDAGNVLRPSTTAKLSLRLPPTCRAATAAAALTDALTADPPSGASVTIDWEAPCDGWVAPPMDRWLHEALHQASLTHFGRPPGVTAEGGTIPFPGMLSERFPHAQFVVTGVLGPGSNAHGPNESLHLPTAKRLTAILTDILGAARRHQDGATTA